MSCKDCGQKKVNRHGTPTVKYGGAETVAEQTVSAAQGFSPDTKGTSQANDFYSDQLLTYKELKERNEAQRVLVRAEGEKAIRQMTQDMRRIYVEQMVGVANGDLVSSSPMSMDQAVLVLYDLLKREDFQHVSEIYPNLFSQVESKWKTIMSNRIVLE